MKQTTTAVPLALLMILAVAGCHEPQDERLSLLVRDTTKQQADQNEAVTELTRDATENHRLVVEAVEDSRTEMMSLQSELQVQRDELEAERKDIASRRYYDSVLGPVIERVGVLLVAVLPLGLCYLLLMGVRRGDDDNAVSEVLVNELLADRELLPRSDRRDGIEHHASESGDADETEFPF